MPRASFSELTSLAASMRAPALGAGLLKGKSPELLSTTAWERRSWWPKVHATGTAISPSATRYVATVGVAGPTHAPGSLGTAISLARTAAEIGSWYQAACAAAACRLELRANGDAGGYTPGPEALAADAPARASVVAASAPSAARVNQWPVADRIILANIGRAVDHLHTARRGPVAVLVGTTAG
jgi:hypothetical protein